MLYLVLSNSTTVLAERLLQHLDAVPDNPFTPERIIIPNAACKRLLQQRMAQRYGICAHVEFTFLAGWIWQLIHETFPGAAAQRSDPDVERWWIYQALREDAYASQPRLAAYLQTCDEGMRFEFAQKIAQLFEQYTNYRTEWLSLWYRDQPLADSDLGEDAVAREDEAWQRRLWRERSAQRKEAPLLLRFLTHLRDGGALPPLPPCLYLFRVPALPPLYLHILAELARRTDVRLYLFNPCREYWFDCVPAKLVSQRQRLHRDAYYDVGHPLLTNWGRQTQAQIDLFYQQACEHFVIDEDSAYHIPKGQSVLVRLQRSIIQLEPPAPATLPWRSDDDSLQVFVCHGLRRELEVIQQNLLALFGRSPKLQAQDVLIVLPDLQQAAPLIEAVFGGAKDGQRLPYRITGLPPRASNPCAQVLLQLLALLRSRFAASEVFALLQQPLVARRFALDLDDIAQIRQWLSDAGIHWGRDAAHVTETLGAAFDDRHTLEQGLLRLFLGAVLPDAAAPIAGVLPHDELEGSAMQALGRFWVYYRQLCAAQRLLSGEADGETWCQRLREVFDAFIAVGADERADWEQVENAMATLQSQFTDSGMTASLPFAVVAHALTQLLDTAPRGGVPSGAITFANLAGLRGVEYAVIIIAGFNDGTFPSQSPGLEFDLMAHRPRASDRQRRLDERNLFLELLLAARDKLWFSYSGRSARDATVLPPSVMLAELLDFIATAAKLRSEDGATDILAHLVIEHPLQSFSARYFQPERYPKLFHFDHTLLDALQRRAPLAPYRDVTFANEEEGEQPALVDRNAPLFASPLTVEETWRDVELDALIRFFCQPCAYWLTQRLGITLDQETEALDDDEPFCVGFSARSALTERILPLLLDGAADHARAVLMAHPALPSGAIGEWWRDSEWQALRRFAMTIRAAQQTPVLPAETPEPLSFNVDDQIWRLTVRLPTLRADGVLYYRYETLRAKDYLRAWLNHLALCAIEPTDVLCQTRCLGRGELRTLLPLPRDSAREQLAVLMRYYALGLSRPLHFFPKSAWEYVTSGSKLEKARNTWQGSPYHTGERQHPAYALALRGIADPLDEEFTTSAREVFGMLWELLQR